ncbi:NAD-dependent epimerase/dehydratase family protein [Limibaculum sp. M0105]|uniref:NAD-dependent epimerase/dehydratase family protein n=1 Tax=Thermohalobaculum xanthum TaxID=2753746 RepID=A0A8J7SBM1_9RHOB|nr:NAD-dependent epimerase/dehydratase family protein [Thermohalobaculum xanthum]MBK0397741.1 NAD-dependent epimerase/dehydratase family protein [Thermohalobaculum xanthum]
MTGAVLVTGAGGFVGGHVVAQLVSAGRRVRGFDLAFPVPLPEGAEPVEGSILDASDLTRAMDGVTGVIHAAAIAHLWTRDPGDYARVNVDGTARVLHAAQAAGARMVLVSSFTTLVGRDAADGAVLDEGSELAPEALLGPYPTSKRQAELAVEAAAADGQNALTVLPSAPVGPGDTRLTPPTAMIRDLAAGRTPALIDCLLNLVDVRALASGIVLALDAGRAGRRYLLSGEDVAMRELAGMIARITGVPAPRATVPMGVALAAGRVEALVSRMTGKPPKAPLTGVRLAARHVQFDASRAREELGFAPPPVSTALRDAIDWLRREGHL